MRGWWQRRRRGVVSRGRASAGRHRGLNGVLLLLACSTQLVKVEKPSPQNVCHNLKYLHKSRTIFQMMAVKRSQAIVLVPDASEKPPKSHATLQEKKGKLTIDAS